VLQSSDFVADDFLKYKMVYRLLLRKREKRNMHTVATLPEIFHFPLRISLDTTSKYIIFNCGLDVKETPIFPYQRTHLKTNLLSCNLKNTEFFFIHFHPNFLIIAADKVR